MKNGRRKKELEYKILTLLVSEMLSIKIYIKVNTKDLYDNYEVKIMVTQKIWRLLKENDILIKI